MSLKNDSNALVTAAMQRIVTISVDDVRQKKDEPNVLLVDLRESHELDRDGMIPDAIHVPRGVLEFRVDPASPYCCDEFLSACEIILYCQTGLRSALAAATLQDMGVPHVSHMEGGFVAWSGAGGEVIATTHCAVLPSDQPPPSNGN